MQIYGALTFVVDPDNGGENLFCVLIMPLDTKTLT